MATPSKQQTIFIIYSNSTTLLGQLAYGIRRMSASTTGTPCAALELTHGGLNAAEKPEWATVKKTIPVEIQQLHHDEIPSELKKYVESNKYGYPCVVGQAADGRFKFGRVLEKRAVQSGLNWK